MSGMGYLSEPGRDGARRQYLFGTARDRSPVAAAGHGQISSRSDSLSALVRAAGAERPRAGTLRGRRHCSAMSLALLASLITALASAETVNFDDVMPGDLPPSWTGTATGKGMPKWTITKNESAPSKPNVLKQ